MTSFFLDDVSASLTHSLQDDSDPRLFAQEVRNCAGSSVMLGLWSAKVSFHTHTPSFR
jgi:hypothetical protein